MSSISGTRHRTRAAVVALLVLSGSPPAGAQGAAPASALSSEARAHFDRGVTFYDEADYPAALVEFKRAYALVPTWQVLFNIGQAYFQVRDYAEALTALRQFVDAGRDQIPEDRRTLVHSELEDLSYRIGYLDISSNLVGATVSIDERAAGVIPLRAPALVSVGVRKITVLYPGRPPVEKEVSVSGGETVEVRLDFEEPSPASAQATDDQPPAALPAAEEAPPSRSRNRVPAIVSFGVAAAGAAVGAIFGGLALRDKSRLSGECLAKACAMGSQADIDAVSRDATMSTIGFGVMAVGAAVGLGLWLTVKGSPVRKNDAGLVLPSGAAPSSLSLRLVPGYVAGTF